MVILAVDDRKSRLDELVKLLRGLFDQATILPYSDPLLAGKYAYFNSVDVLFTALNMHRMNGINLKKMAHCKNAEAKVFLLGEQAEFEETEVFEGDNWLNERRISGVVLYPLRREAFLAQLQKNLTQGVPVSAVS